MHGHAQIQYHDGATESYVSFDPFDGEDHASLHQMLDEFIKNHVQPAVRGEIVPLDGMDFFTVFGFVD